MPEFIFKTLNFLHSRIIRCTKGKIGTQFYDMPIVTLITTGRSSGLPRKVLLSSPIQYDGKWVLIASKGGAPDHPQWYKNLKANPEVEIIRPKSTTAKQYIAREATEDEYPALWDQTVKKYHGYANYQKKTARTIPIVILEPKK